MLAVLPLACLTVATADGREKKKKEKICFVLGIFPKEHEGYLIGVKMNTVSKQKLKHKVNIKIYVDK